MTFFGLLTLFLLFVLWNLWPGFPTNTSCMVSFGLYTKTIISKTINLGLKAMICFLFFTPLVSSGFVFLWGELIFGPGLPIALDFPLWNDLFFSS